jgi:sugar lactone lactonase YvrE
VFISDTGNNVVRKVTAGGTISTFAGQPGFGGIGSGGDGGPATKAQLAFPSALAVDALKNVYIADTSNNKVRVVNPAGVITTFAGSSYGFGGDGGLATRARLAGPSGLDVDMNRNLYISDTGNNRIRVVDPTGVITTFAGTGMAGYSGDGGPATNAMIDFPVGGVASDGVRVFFSDTGNSRIRAVTAGPPPVIPETQYILLLPISALALGGAGLLVARRRRRRDQAPPPGSSAAAAA